MSFWFCYGFGTQVQNIITGNIRIASSKVCTDFSLPLLLLASLETKILNISLHRVRNLTGTGLGFTGQHTKKTRSLNVLYSDCPFHSVWVLLIYISFLSVIQLPKDQVFSYMLMKNRCREKTTRAGVHFTMPKEPWMTFILLQIKPVNKSLSLCKQ